MLIGIVRCLEVFGMFIGIYWLLFVSFSDFEGVCSCF